MNLLKKIAVCLMCVLFINVLSACDNIVDDRHRTQKEAQEIAEELVGTEVTYVETKEYEEKKKIVYIFKDARDNEFAIISALSQANIDGASFGPYYCCVMDAYASGVFVSHKEEVMDIIEKYDLDEYVSSTRVFDVDIYSGEGIVGASIDIDVDEEFFKDNYEQNEDILKRTAAAGAEIDALLALNYNGANMDNSYKGGYYYEYYGVGVGIRLCYVENRINDAGEPYKNYDIAHFDFSSSSDNRWTEEKLYENLSGQLERAIQKK